MLKLTVNSEIKMTKLQKLTKDAVMQFVTKKMKLDVFRIRHIYPRAYVLCRPAACCIVVARPPTDSEPHLREMKRFDDNSEIIRDFDDELQAGDWCSVAYVASKTMGTIVAVKCVG